MIHVCENGGAELCYQEFGDKGHPLLVLIAGAGAPAEFWPEQFCEELSRRRFHVLRFWHRDTGESAHFDAPYAIGVLVDDVLALIVNAGAERAHLVGHSMGGYVAQLAAVGHPNKVRSCVAMAAGPLVSEEGKARLALSPPDEALWPKLMANQPHGDFEHDLPGWLDSWQILNGDLAIENDLALAYTRALYRGPASNHQVAENHIHAMTTVPDSLADDLLKTGLPILYLHGEADPLVPPDHGRKAAELAASGAFASLPRAGHMYFNRSTWDLILDAVEKHCIAA